VNKPLLITTAQLFVRRSGGLVSGYDNNQMTSKIGNNYSQHSRSDFSSHYLSVNIYHMLF